jgi:hypothetical protein
MPSTSPTPSVRERPASRTGSSCERAISRRSGTRGVCLGSSRVVRTGSARAALRQSGPCQSGPCRSRFSAGVAQLVERQPSKLNVASSNLVSRSVFISDFWGPNPKNCRAAGVVPSCSSWRGPNPKNWRQVGSSRTGWMSSCFAHLAQLVEHVLGKDEVTSSILVVGSKRLWDGASFGGFVPRRFAVNAVHSGDGVPTESATH